MQNIKAGSIDLLRAFVVVGLLTLTACSDTDDRSDVESIGFTLTYAQDSEGVLLPTSRPVESGVRMTFQLIPGHLFGSVLPEFLIDASFNSMNETDIFFDNDIFTQSSQPATLNSAAIDDGWTITPGDTLFGRLGVFARNADGGFIPASGGYLLYDDFANRHFMIVYFNQAATLQGSTVYQEGTITTINVQIPSQGFYRLGSELSRNSDGMQVRTWSVVNTPSNALFAIVE